MYKLLDDGYVYNEETGAFIPPDLGNRHYQEYLNWVVDQSQADQPQGDGNDD